MKVEYFSDDKWKYSTALMFAYINICKPIPVKLNIDQLKFNLNYNCWENNIKYINVINDMNNKLYKEELDRINKADTKYNIIVDERYNILDGMHRHILEKRKFINVYVFDKKLMKKFIVAKREQPIKL